MFVPPRTSRRFLMRAVLLALLLAAAESEAVATPLSLFKNVNNTDIATAGVGGMRNVGSADISLGGIQTTAVVTQAYLYWNGPTMGYANDRVKINGVSITGTNIGISGDNSWGYAETHTYRAVVTDIVKATGNGIYHLTNFGGAGTNTNGASLVVLFDDRDPSNNRNVWLFDGNDSNQPNSHDGAGWSASFPDIKGTSSDATLEMHVGDGQTDEDGLLEINNAVIAQGSIFSSFGSITKRRFAGLRWSMGHQEIRHRGCDDARR